MVLYLDTEIPHGCEQIFYKMTIGNCRRLVACGDIHIVSSFESMMLPKGIRIHLGERATASEGR